MEQQLVYTITSELNPVSSCQELVRDCPHAASDYHWVLDKNRKAVNIIILHY